MTIEVSDMNVYSYRRDLVVATIVLLQYAPGVVTAVLINLPLTGMILFSLHSSQEFTAMDLAVAIVCGGSVGIALA